jgi:hypothetical protein
MLLAMLDDAVPGVRIQAIHALACDHCKSAGCRPVAAAVLTARSRRSAATRARWYARTPSNSSPSGSTLTTARSPQCVLPQLGISRRRCGRRPSGTCRADRCTSGRGDDVLREREQPTRPPV